MLKKIRCIYWKQRDKGKGCQCLLACSLVLFLSVFLVVIIRLGVGNHPESVSGAAVTVSAVSGSAVSVNAVSVETVEGTDEEEEKYADQKEKADAGSSEREGGYHLETEGINTLSGFMSDSAYAKLVSQLTTECEKKRINSVQRLDYQKINDTWKVTVYLLASDGSVWEVGYNLKNSAVTLAATSLSEKDVTAMKKAEEKKEAARLKKQREAAKKKQAKAKKKSGKKKKTKKDVG